MTTTMDDVMNKERWEVFNNWRDTFNYNDFTPKEFDTRMTLAINLLKQGYVL